MNRHAGLCFCCLAGLFSFAPFAQGADKVNPLAGYADYQAFEKQVHDLQRLGQVRISELARTSSGRAVYLLTIGRGNVDTKPAILLIGSVEAAQLVGSEVTVRMARLLATRAETDKQVSALLDRVTVYVIPRPNPDGSEKCFGRPYWEHWGNGRATDDDRDQKTGEDGPDDLNGDGLITMMRVEDDAGEYRPLAADPRVMIKADPKKNEHGRYRLYIEGRDDDRDEKFNEDPGDGVALNRNFTFRYPYFAVGAGPHQVSEPESRAVADFAFGRANVALVFSFSPQDNLIHPWPADNGPAPRIREAVDAADAPYLALLSNEYRKVRDPAGAPASASAAGALAPWAYFHYGRWSLSTNGWWMPQAPSAAEGKSKEKDPPASSEKAKPETAAPKTQGPGVKSDESAAESKPDDRGQEDAKALRWFAKEQIEGFVPWTPIKHPDFPDRKVEIGGFSPFVRLNPPAAQLDPLADQHFKFLVDVAGKLPQLKITSTKLDALGSGVFRLTATVANDGFLPTTSKMGEVSEQLQVLQAELELPDGTTLVQGNLRQRLPRLDGNGGRADAVWILRSPADKNSTVKLKVYAPEIGAVEQVVEIKR